MHPRLFTVLSRVSEGAISAGRLFPAALDVAKLAGLVGGVSRVHYSVPNMDNLMLILTWKGAPGCSLPSVRGNPSDEPECRLRQPSHSRSH